MQSAKDKGTGKENKITIKANSGLSEADIQEMVNDAQLRAEDDKKKVALLQALNADATVHGANKVLAEHPGADGTTVKSAIAAVEDAVKAEDASLIEAKTEGLV